jgi:hypothetical protein
VEDRDGLEALHAEWLADLRQAFAEAFAAELERADAAARGEVDSRDCVSAGEVGE